MSQKEVIEKAYGNIPKEVGITFNMVSLPTLRDIKCYCVKLIRRLK